MQQQTGRPPAIQTLATDPSRPDLGGNIRGGDPNTWCPALWRYLIGSFGVRSVLDVGCGEGHAVKWFRDAGIDAEGIDGLALNVERAVTPILLHDLTAGPFIHPVDLVWCCEVAEHIDPEKVDNLIDTLANGRVIAMTHAVPGQGGWHHVNCQPAGYWIEQIEARGYRRLQHPRTGLTFFRTLATLDGPASYFACTGLVFCRV